MKNRDIIRRMLIIAIPAGIQYIVNYLQMSTDLAFIGHYDSAGLSALQNARTAYFFLLSFFLSFNSGTNILIAQSLGANLKRKARRFAEVALFYNQLLSFGYLLFWQVSGKSFLALLGAKGTVLELSVEYVSVLSLVFVFEGLIFTASAIFQGRGQTIPITISAIIRTLLNVPLDWCLVYGRWGFPEMGIPGAALATVISEFIGGLFLLILAFRNQEFRLSIKAIFRPIWSLYRKIIVLGAPSGLESMIWAGGNIGIVWLLNTFSQDAAGKVGVLTVIRLMAFCVYFGFGVATLTMVGMAIGGRKYPLAQKIGRLTLWLSFGVCAAVGLLYLLIPKVLLSIFVNDPAVIVELTPLLAISALILFPQAFNVVGGNSIRARGDTRWMLITQIPGTLLIIPLVYVAMFSLHLGLKGLLWVVLFDETWRALANYARLRHLSRKEQAMSVRIVPHVVPDIAMLPAE